MALPDIGAPVRGTCIMVARILDGNSLAEDLLLSLQKKAAEFTSQNGRAAHVSIIVIGSDTGAALFGAQVIRKCQKIGVATSSTHFDADVTESAIRDYIETISGNSYTDGVIVLLPLPENIHQSAIMATLNPAKDVDGLGPKNAGNLVLGFPSFTPGTAEAVTTLLDNAGIPIQGQHAVILGRSNVGGKPVAMELLRRNATITICHTHTKNLPEITRTADIIVASIGQPEFLTGDMIRPGAVVLDAGANVTAAGLKGDAHAPSIREKAGWFAPTPGGLGPLTHLMVIRNTLFGAG